MYLKPILWIFYHNTKRLVWLGLKNSAETFFSFKSASEAEILVIVSSLETSTRQYLAFYQRQHDQNWAFQSRQRDQNLDGRRRQHNHNLGGHRRQHCLPPDISHCTVSGHCAVTNIGHEDFSFRSWFEAEKGFRWIFYTICVPQGVHI